MGFKAGAEWNGNRKGRPRTGSALADRIRAECGSDGERLVAFLMRVAFGQDKKAKADIRARLIAAGMLLERGFGKPPQDVTFGLGDDGPKRVKFILERA